MSKEDIHNVPMVKVQILYSKSQISITGLVYYQSLTNSH